MASFGSSLMIDRGKISGTSGIGGGVSRWTSSRSAKGTSTHEAQNSSGLPARHDPGRVRIDIRSDV